MKTREDVDVYNLRQAQGEAALSPDPSTKCGAVIAGQTGFIVSRGHNAFPCKCRQDAELYANRPLKYERVVHAEVAAILNAKRDVTGMTLYSWPPANGPSCARCAAVIIEAGITRVVYKHEPTTDITSRWAESINIGLEMFREAGVEVVAL